MFYCKFHESFKNTFFHRTSLVAASLFSHFSTSNVKLLTVVKRTIGNRTTVFSMIVFLQNCDGVGISLRKVLIYQPKHARTFKFEALYIKFYFERYMKNVTWKNYFKSKTNKKDVVWKNLRTFHSSNSLSFPVSTTRLYIWFLETFFQWELNFVLGEKINTLSSYNLLGIQPVGDSCVEIFGKSFVLKNFWKFTGKRSPFFSTC